MGIENLVSLAGIPVLLAFAWLFSTDRRNLNFRAVLWGIGLQLAIAALVFSFDAGTRLFRAANAAVVLVLDSAAAGAEFVFGRLAVPPGAVSAAGEPSMGFILAFQALPTILFFSALMALLYHPFVLLLGVPPADAGLAARIIGERTVVTELTAYVDLDRALASGAFTDPRTPVIVAYALCGFAHVASLAIFVGGVSALAPDRTGDLARLGSRALLGATIACLITACVAGAFYREGTFLLGAP